MNRSIKKLLTVLIIVALISVCALSGLMVACENGNEGGNGSGNGGSNGSYDPNDPDSPYYNPDDPNNPNSDDPDEDDAREEIIETGYSDALYNVIYTVVVEEAGEDKVPTETMKEVRAHCDKVDSLLKVYLTDNDDYIDLRDEFTNNTQMYKTTISRVYKGEKNDDDTNTIFSLLSLYTTTMGKDEFASLIYDFVSYLLKYNSDSLANNDYKSQALKQEALEDYTIFTTKIDKKEFSKFFNNTLLIFDLLNEKKGNDGSFSLLDSEIADLIKRPDFKVSIPVEGWEVLIKEMGKLNSDDSLVGRMYNSAHDTKNEDNDNKTDIRVLAEKMENIVQFMCDVQGYMDKDMVYLLRNDRKAFMVALIGKMKGDAQKWMNVRTMLDIDLAYDYGLATLGYYSAKNPTYDGHATNYATYRTSVKKYTVDDLKTATTENIEEVLEGVVATISPAFSFEFDFFKEEAK